MTEIKFDLSMLTTEQRKALTLQLADEAKAKQRKNPVSGISTSMRVGPSGTAVLSGIRQGAPYYPDEWFAILSDVDQVVNFIRANVDNAALSLGKTPERQARVRALVAREDVQAAADALVKALRS